MYDFFISYSHADKQWAVWIAWQLEAERYTTVLQAWDFPVGSHFPREMQNAHNSAERTLVVLSQEYIDAEFTMSEWNARYAEDPVGAERRLVPVKVRECSTDSFWKPIVFIDLTNRDAEDARRTLLAGLPEPPIAGEKKATPARRRQKPEDPPPFPPAEDLAPCQLRDYSHLIQVDKEKRFEVIGDELYSIVFSLDHKWVAAGSEKKVVLWDRSSPKTVRLLKGPKSFVYSVAFSNDSLFLASGCEDHAVRVWDMTTQKLLWEKKQHNDAVYSVSFSCDGTLLVSGGYDHAVKVWDAKSGQMRFSYDQDIGRITAVAFAPRGRLIAFGSLDDYVRLWDPGDDQVRKLGKHDSSVEAIAFSPDGKLLASCGLDKYVCVWDITAGKEKWRKRQHEYLARSVAFSPDGATLASAGWDKSVKLWDVESGKVVKSLPFDHEKPWHKDWIWSVAFSPDGSTLASSGSDGQVILWRVNDSESA